MSITPLKIGFILLSCALASTLSAKPAPQSTTAATTDSSAVPMRPVSGVHTPYMGCIGQTVLRCIMDLRTIMRFSDYDNIYKHATAPSETDVNGRPLGNKKILRGSGFLFNTNSRTSLSITIFSNDSHQVTEVDIELAMAILYARTTDDYEKTGFYKEMRVMSGDECAGDNPIKLYQWFENVVKPRISPIHRSQEWTDTSVSTSYEQQANNIRKCGGYFSFISVAGTDTDQITLNNTTGAWGASVIKFSSSPIAQ